VPVPAITDTQVLIKIKAAGVCHSDIMAFKGQHPYRVPPVITGHEAAGEVAAVGRAVTRVKPGDRVVIEPHIGCGTCWFCRRKEYNVCPDKRLIGVGTWMGVFAEYAMAEEPMCFRMPDGMSWEEGAAVEPFVVGLHAVRNVEIVEAWQEAGQDYLKALFSANLLDYTTDDRTGTVIAGSRTEPVKFEECWTFTRIGSNGPWKLCAIRQV